MKKSQTNVQAESFEKPSYTEFMSWLNEATDKKSENGIKIHDGDDDDEGDEDDEADKCDEELKGNQHKLDKNKNGKLDAHDFKLLRKVKKEDVDLGEAELEESFVVKDHQGKRVHVAYSEGEAKKKAEELSKKTGKKHDVVFTRSAVVTKEEVTLDEVSSELLDRYKDKAKQSADALAGKGDYKKSSDRWLNVMKATGKQIDKTVENIKKLSA